MYASLPLMRPVCVRSCDDCADAEVDDLDVARARHEDVRRRHVAVHELQRRAVLVDLGVRVVEGLAELEEEPDRDVDRWGPRDLAGVAEDPTDVASVDVLHRDEVLGADAAELVDLNDVDVVEDRGQLGLAHERFDEARVLGEVRQESLQGDDAFEPLDAAFECAMHGGHPTHSEPLVHQVRPELLCCVELGSHDPSGREDRTPARSVHPL
jgi:hypothetical protein